MGRVKFIYGDGASLRAAAEWARALCHLVLGPEEGERHYRQLPALAVLALWGRRRRAPEGT